MTEERKTYHGTVFEVPDDLKYAFPRRMEEHLRRGNPSARYRDGRLAPCGRQLLPN